MGQSVTHGLLSLSFLVQLKDNDKEETIKNLLYEAKNLGLQLDYREVLEESSISVDSSDKFVLSCVSGHKITTRLMASIATFFSNHNVNILRIDNAGKNKFHAMEIQVSASANTDIEKLKKELVFISNQYNVDMAFLKKNVFRRSKRLIVFDMDSTLIKAEVIDEMAKTLGVGEKVQKITEEAMNGERSFDEALLERVSFLKGLKKEQMEQIAQTIELNPGVETFIKTVKQLGYKLAVISGGFNYFTNYFKNKLELDYAFGNELEIKDGVATGKICGTIINPTQKALILDMLAQQNNISLEQVVAIGDGANDLPMLAKAGLGIAYHAKETVKEKASEQVSHGTMTSILYFLGINDL